jgi:hypothetical protein
MCRHLVLGSEVLVWRIHEKAWTRPHKLISIDGENATIEVNRRLIRFRTTVVKPYVQEPEADNTPEIAQEITLEAMQPDKATQQEPRCGSRTRRLKQFPDADIYTAGITIFELGLSFTQSRQKELNGVYEGNVFKVIDIADIPLNS